MSRNRKLSVITAASPVQAVLRGLLIAVIVAPIAAFAQGTADLSLTKQASTETVEPGTQFNYQFTIRNNGPDDANGVFLSDQFPNELNFISCSAPSSTFCGEDGIGGFRAEFDSIDTGDLRQVLLFVELDESTAPDQQIVNSAIVTTFSNDPNMFNNEAAASIFTPSADPIADLALTKNPSAETVVIGTQFDYTFTITNIGPDEAERVVLIDDFSEELNFVSCSTSGSGGTCELLSQGGTDAFRASFETMDSGTSRDVTLTVELDESTPPGVEIVNEAEVVSLDADDPDGNNNSASASILSKSPPEPLILYLHGTDVPGTAGGFTMDDNPPSPPQPLQLNLANAPAWYSEPALDGTFAAGDFVLSFPCAVGISLATTYGLHRTALDGSNPELMASLTQPLQICTGVQAITIPVSGAEEFDDERLRLRISTLLGLTITLDLGEDVKLETPEFEQADDPAPI